MNINPQNHKVEFNRFLLEEIDLSIYKHKYLNDYVNKLMSGNTFIYETSLLNRTDDGWIIIIHSDHLLIYGHNWTVDQFREIKEVFNLNAFKNYTVTGEDELINELVRFYNPRNYHIMKRRQLYQANNINIYENELMNINLADETQIDELATMMQDYYHEEYNGLNDKTFADMQNRIISLVNLEKIYILKSSNNELVSFCTIVDPDIGILFTKREYRNKGFGKLILSYCANQLQIKNGIVYLMTDLDMVESNKVCQQVGFTSYYRYLMVEINRN